MATRRFKVANIKVIYLEKDIGDPLFLFHKMFLFFCYNFFLIYLFFCFVEKKNLFYFYIIFFYFIFFLMLIYFNACIFFILPKNTMITMGHHTQYTKRKYFITDILFELNYFKVEISAILKRDHFNVVTSEHVVCAHY